MIVERIALEPADVDRLAGELRSPYDVAVTLGAWTYLRPSELLALERGDVDGDVLHVRRTLDGEGGTKARAKTRRSLRTIPLPLRARQALAELVPRLDTRLLFPAPSGAPWDACNFRRREFKWAAEAAGFQNVTPYTLRHSGISWALAAGIPASDVARFAGTSVTMLETTTTTFSKRARMPPGSGWTRSRSVWAKIGPRRVCPNDEAPVLRRRFAGVLLMRPVGIEPTTSGSGGQRSIP